MLFKAKILNILSFGKYWLAYTLFLTILPSCTVGEVERPPHPEYRISCPPLVSSDAFYYENGSFVFRLEKGQVGNCPSDRRPYSDPFFSFEFSERQEITMPLYDGVSIISFDFMASGASAQRAAFFQIHDGRGKGAPPAWIGLNENWDVIFHDSLSRTYKRLAPNRIYHVEVRVDYEAPFINSTYFIDGDEIRTIRAIESEETDSPYGDRSYIKIGIYRVNSNGATTFSYQNLEYRPIQ